METKIKENLAKLDDLQKQVAGASMFIKDQLNNDADYHAIQENIKELNEKKKKIISRINADNEKELERIDVLKAEVQKQKQIISDLTLSKIVRGENTRIINKKGMVMVPVVSVKFKKTGDYENPESNN